ncbi:phosphatidylserine decarboxylase [Bacteroides ovatus]|uniref:Phosphatidylserine decarboxylase proenzyme n=1 Tax=Bacteroides ovatus TaxID=28116 RepID=A0A1G6GEX3_BACOV|nr:phosphatidylserine decarboxylase family protein [Bacteroides ovatus]SDB79716.1 phosphatidylserine decarboxylase [Bacteroides ovatus]
MTLTIIGCSIFSFMSYFFRNPKRKVPVNNNVVYAPADGKIVALEEVFENEYLNVKCIKVSIFMSMLNVHVNRYPISGVIKYSKYHPGRYFIAYYPKASEFNEHHSTVIETPEGQSVLVKQIAGIIARRIVCYANIGKETVQGEDLGFIKFGSRVDLFLPLGTSIAIEKGEKVKGNNTIVAFLDMKD